MDAFATARYGLITKWVRESGRTGVVDGNLYSCSCFTGKIAYPGFSTYPSCALEICRPRRARVTNKLNWIPATPRKSSEQILQANPPSRRWTHLKVVKDQDPKTSQIIIVSSTSHSSANLTQTTKAKAAKFLEPN